MLFFSKLSHHLSPPRKRKENPTVKEVQLVYQNEAICCAGSLGRPDGGPIPERTRPGGPESAAVRQPDRPRAGSRRQGVSFWSE